MVLGRFERPLRRLQKNINRKFCSIETSAKLDIEMDAFKGKYHQYFRQIYLGTEYIPLTELTYFGKYYINTNKWDYEDKWEYLARIFDIEPEEVIIEDEDLGKLLGRVEHVRISVY